jgi:phage gp29-like protein
MMAEEKIAAPEKNEIATTQDGRDITRGFVDGMPLLPPQDKLLQLKGAGDLKIYQEVLRDDKVKTCLAQRFSAVTSRAWNVKPGGNKLVDKKAAEFLSEQLNNLQFDDITEKMLYGVFYGYSVAEVIWDVADSRIIPRAIKVRDRRRFGFAPDMSLRLKTMSKPMGEILPERKFWSFSCGADHHDEPYGLGLAHWLYWPVFFKRSGIKFWLKFLDKFGTPTAHGTYPAGTEETEQDKLLNALRDIQNDSAVITPEGMVITLLEATRSGAADYASMVRVMDDAIAQVILGQTASTQGTPGKLGNEQLQSDVRLDIVKADADLICMSLNAGPARWLTDWNFAGAAYPTVWREVEEPEDLDKRADRDTKVKQLGYKPTLKYVQETYGGEWEESAANDETNPPGPENNQASFAEPGESATGQLEDELVKHSAGGWQSTVKKVQAIVDQATDLTTLQKQLTAQFADMTEDDLVNVMAAGFALAELKGMSDVQDEGNA